MKLLKLHNIKIAVLLLGVTLLAACQRTELCYDHYPKVALSFEWEKEWERDYGMQHPENWDASLHGFDYDFLRPETPEWINLVHYHSDGSTDHYFKPEGGEVVLKEDGDHSFLLYNGDTEYNVFSDIASLPDARVSATPRTRASLTYIMNRHPDTKSANAPDVIYSSFIEKVPSVGVHETKPVNVKMQPLVFTYVVRYEFEAGMEHVSLARGALAGMAESVYLRDGRTSEESIIILFDCEVKDYGCEAHVRSFGVPGFPDEYYGRSGENVPDRPYTLNLEVLLTTGKTKEFNIDVADQIKKQPRGGVIIVKGLRIEDAENTAPSGGFDVGLDGWGEVDVELPV